MLRMFIFGSGVLLLCGASSLYAQVDSFLSHWDIPIGAACCTVVSGDFNGDGKLDLVVGYGTGNLGLLLGDGAGGFKPRIELTTFKGRIQKIAAADVNRDGKLDLLIGTGRFGTGISGALQTYVLLGRGDGTFQSASQVSAAGIPLFVADLNGDGLPDLGVRIESGAGCDLQVQLGNGDGTFQKPLCTQAPENMGAEVAIGDFNGDGIPDLVWGSGRSNGGVWLFLGNGDGTFRRAPSFGAQGNGSRKALAVGDLNHDGKLDVVIGSFTSVFVFFGKGDGTVQKGIEIPLDFWDDTISNVGSDLFIADLNGDGKPDIVTDNVVILGNGDGTFQPVQYLLPTSPRPSSLICADLNGDHFPDLIYVDYDLAQNATSLSVLLNDTPGLPSSVVGYSAATGVDPVAPSSIASVYGKNLAPASASANGPTLPTQLGGISLRVRDSTDTVRLAPLIYVSPTQINFLVPDQTAIGPAVLTVDDGSSPLVETANATPVTQFAPGIFSANGQGQGAAAATAVRVLPDGTQQPVTVFNCGAPGQCTTVPIEVGGQQLFLNLYGTGMRGARLLRCQVGGLDATVQFAGAQPSIPGLDQINILLPAKLPSGIMPVQCQFEFSPAYFSGLSTTNPVQIQIK